MKKVAGERRREKEEVKIAGNRRRESTVQRVQLKEGIASGAVTYYLRFDGSAMQPVVRVCSVHTEEHARQGYNRYTRHKCGCAGRVFPPTLSSAVVGRLHSALLHRRIPLSRCCVERKHVNYSVVHPPAVHSTRLTASLFAHFFDKSRNIEANYKLDGRTRQFLAARLSFGSHRVFSHQLLC